MRYIPGVNRPYGYAHAGKLHRHSGAAENCGGEAIHTDEVCDPAPRSEAAASSRGWLTWGAPLPEKRKPKSKDPKPETWKSTAEICAKAGPPYVVSRSPANRKARARVMKMAVG